MLATQEVKLASPESQMKSKYLKVLKKIVLLVSKKVLKVFLGY